MIQEIIILVLDFDFIYRIRLLYCLYILRTDFEVGMSFVPTCRMVYFDEILALFFFILCRSP